MFSAGSTCPAIRRLRGADRVAILATHWLVRAPCQAVSVRVGGHPAFPDPPPGMLTQFLDLRSRCSQRCQFPEWASRSHADTYTLETFTAKHPLSSCVYHLNEQCPSLEWARSAGFVSQANCMANASVRPLAGQWRLPRGADSCVSPHVPTVQDSRRGDIWQGFPSSESFWSHRGRLWMGVFPPLHR